jgi:hypothetical protein
MKNEEIKRSIVMWIWKNNKEYQRVPGAMEEHLTPQEMVRLRSLGQRQSACSEFVCGAEERRLQFVRWLVQQGRLKGDT